LNGIAGNDSRGMSVTRSAMAFAAAVASASELWDMIPNQRLGGGRSELQQ